MKGIVFNEFLEMVESKMGDEMLDDMLESVSLESEGIYTSVGTYPHEELVAMVSFLSKHLDTPVADLVRTFGEHLGHTFTVKFPAFFEQAGDTIGLLKSIDEHIHVEVKKLYPDADLPNFTFSEDKEGNFVLHYESVKGFADLAEGLIKATMEHYKENYSMTRVDDQKGNLHTSDFTLIAV